MNTWSFSNMKTAINVYSLNFWLLFDATRSQTQLWKYDHVNPLAYNPHFSQTRVPYAQYSSHRKHTFPVFWDCATSQEHMIPIHIFCVCTFGWIRPLDARLSALQHNRSQNWKSVSQVYVCKTEAYPHAKVIVIFSVNRREDNSFSKSTDDVLL